MPSLKPNYPHTRKLLTILGAIVMIHSGNQPLLAQESTPVEPSNYEDGKFVNSTSTFTTGLKDLWKTAKAYVTAERKSPMPSNPIPLMPLEMEDLEDDKRDAVYRLSHSTMLIRLNKQLILTDPVFSDRASPVQWFGPKRFHETPITINNLPNIDIVVISHDHYDHLDKDSIKQLANKVDRFIVPLKVGKHLRKWGIQKEKITELDWWQELESNGIKLVATPTQHFSGRGLFDRDETLWASWVFIGTNSRMYFSGDSGYFPGFKEIGDRYGPFDITMIETGAYNENWESIHMMPEQSLQAHQDLNGIAMLPIHNSTFDLSLHDWQEPLERANQLALDHNVALLTPVFGEAIYLADVTARQFGSANTWWRKIEPDTLLTTTNNTESILVN